MRYEDILFPSVDDVIATHAEVLFPGEARGLLKPSTLDSAVNAPAATMFGRPLHRTLADMAAAYAHGIAQGHPFEDGNKRIAIATAFAFLGDNGHPLRAGPEWEGIMFAVASGTFSREALAARFASLLPGGDPIAIDP